jgi:hypothetical protein
MYHRRGEQGMHTEFGWEIRLECFGLETIRVREYYVKKDIFGKEVLMTAWSRLSSDRHVCNAKYLVSNTKSLVINLLVTSIFVGSKHPVLITLSEYTSTLFLEGLKC